MKLGLTKSSGLSIQLVEDEIFLRNSEEAASLIRGNVHFRTSQPVFVNFLQLNLVGIITTNWNYEGRVIQDKAEVLRKEWKLLQTSGYLSSGEHVYHFESTLSSSLPPSIKCQNGRVEYKLIATINRNCRNKKTSRIVKLTRSEAPSSSTIMDSIFSQGNYLNLFSYQLACPHRAFGPDDKIPLNFTISSFDTDFDYEVKSISCLIKRTVTMKTRRCDNQWISKRKEEILNVEHKSFSPKTRSINETLNLPIQAPKRGWPIHSPKFIPTSSNILMDIQYDVKARIIFKTPDGNTCDMLLKFPIVVMTKNYNEIGSELPNYNNRDTLLIESVPPSYQPTWCPLTRHPSLSSLPSYDETIYPTSIKSLPKCKMVG